MNLIISSAIDRIKLAKFLRDYYQKSLSEAIVIINNLPFKTTWFYSKESLKEKLLNVAVFSLELTEEELLRQNSLQTYEKAKQWYFNLSKEEQYHVNVLIRCGQPQGF